MQKKQKKGNIALFIPHAGCKNACVFCNQREISGTLSLPTENEIRSAAAKAAETDHLDLSEVELAFFGGSFTALPFPLMESYLALGKELVDQYGLKGIRLSTRPDALEEKRIEMLLHYGVTAVELGAQSFCEEVLKKTERGHTKEDIIKGAKAVKEAGFELTLQLMTGLPCDTPDGTMLSAEEAAALMPTAVRIYPCLVLEHTSLANLWREGKYQPQSLEEAVELCAKLLDFFEEKQIEVRKVGLHASEGYEEGALLAGPYHPAFRELCDSMRMYKKIEAQLALVDTKGKHIVFTVSPADRSIISGQRKQNLNRLIEQFQPASLTINTQNELLRGKILAEVKDEN